MKKRNITTLSAAVYLLNPVNVLATDESVNIDSGESVAASEFISVGGDSSSEAVVTTTGAVFNVTVPNQQKVWTRA